MREYIKIRKADINDMDKIADLILSINEQKGKITKYNDFNFNHSKESLREVLSGKNKNEMIFIAMDKENFVGMIDFYFSDSNYMFFIDKFVYIKYLYVDKNKFIYTQDYSYVSKRLFETLINKAKEYGVKYVCADVLSKEDELKELFEMNEMTNYKNRLYKKVNAV
ncbi:GNAT family N-acetyltransferase [Clostridium botulinum]|nr:GNAT family N-acetyltransferase [Clostridium botulinum]